VRRRTGRPHYFYTLTDKSDDHFPKSYDRLASAILSELKGSDGPERAVALLRDMGERLGDQYAAQLAGRTFEERLNAVVSLLNNGSGLGEWQRAEDGYLLREFDCPYRKVAVEHPEVCELHAQIMIRALDVDVERIENQARGDVRCTYLVRPRSEA
jgi:predicted ArsR family transcriptional regulator